MINDHTLIGTIISTNFAQNVSKNSDPVPENDSGPSARYQLNMGEIGRGETLETSVLVNNTRSDAVDREFRVRGEHGTQ